MKKGLCLLVILTLALTMLLVSCTQQEQQGGEQTSEQSSEQSSEQISEAETTPLEPSEGLIFELNMDEECYVTGIGNCTDKHILIPEYSPDSHPVIGIAENAFLDSDIEGIYIPAGITDVNCWAFVNCAKLRRVVVDENNPVYYSADNCLIERETNILVLGSNASIIPEGVQCIGNGAFQGRTELTSIQLPASVAIIDDNAFGFCTNLASINIPDNVTKIGMGAFSGCTSLTEFNIPDSVTSIGLSAFGTMFEEYHAGMLKFENGLVLVDDWVVDCETGVTSVDLTGIKGIADYAFAETEIVNITIPDSVRAIGMEAFFSCRNLTDISIPDSVINIGDEAFEWCTGLTSIIISESVVNIGSGAFAYCEALTSITVDENNPIYYSKDNCVIETNTNTLVLGCKTSIIPEGITSIGDRAFEGCKLTKIVIPKSVTKIGEYSFYNCAASSFVEYIVCYSGTEEEWRAIEKDYGNFERASIRCNYVPEE